MAFLGSFNGGGTFRDSSELSGAPKPQSQQGMAAPQSGPKPQSGSTNPFSTGGAGGFFSNLLGGGSSGSGSSSGGTGGLLSSLTGMIPGFGGGGSGSNFLNSFMPGGGGSGNVAGRPIGSQVNNTAGSGASAVPGAGDPQSAARAEAALRAKGLKTCMFAIKDSSGNVIAVSPQQIKVSDPCPSGSIEQSPTAPLTVATIGTAIATGQVAPSTGTPATIDTKTGEGASYPTPFYKKWWVWAIAGAVLVGGSTAIYFATREKKPVGYIPGYEDAD